MSAEKIQIPENSCAYEEYDPISLTPANDKTYIRLMELGWDKEQFADKSVLDIGGNSGILSLYAYNLGAKNIQYVDVQEPLVDFFQSVVEKHELPIDVAKKGFLELDPKIDSKDVVLCMEVLHWLVDQGTTVTDSVKKLADLTNETLYLETPWDISEPSIAHKGVVLEEDYNIELILRELQAHFMSVEMIRFMTYFGKMKDSKRILIKAKGKRDNSLQTGDEFQDIDLNFSLANVAA